MDQENDEMIDLKMGSGFEFVETVKTHYVYVAIGLFILFIFLYYYFTNGFSDAPTSLIPPPQATSNRPYTSGADARFGSTFSGTDQGEFTSGFDITRY